MSYGIEDIALYPLKRCREDGSAFDYISQAFRHGVSDGSFDPMRGAPTGEERAVVARAPDGTHVGFITWWQPHRNKKFSWIDVVWVNHPWRQQRLATRLLGAAIEQHPAGYRLQLGCFASNAIMLRIAERAGFAEYSRTFERRLA